MGAVEGSVHSVGLSAACHPGLVWSAGPWLSAAPPRSDSPGTRWQGNLMPVKKLEYGTRFHLHIYTVKTKKKLGFGYGECQKNKQKRSDNCIDLYPISDSTNQSYSIFCYFNLISFVSCIIFASQTKYSKKIGMEANCFSSMADVTKLTRWARGYCGKLLSSITVQSYTHKCHLEFYCAKKEAFCWVCPAVAWHLWALRHLEWTIARWRPLLLSDQLVFKILWSKGPYALDQGQKQPSRLLSGTVMLCDGMRLYRCL